ncbi:hypothetical protein CJF30_00006433 [Rutstroemia sp. NJR-2017a BBW]|nr:hypothetical protein CJF30_00006433 [Rutstroemia sp. NJR-2017a BBW]
MSFDQLSSMESQPTTMRREDDPQYADDPAFQQLSQDLSAKLFTLTGNISRLSNEINLLGTKRDTERVRERVHDLLEESKDTFKHVGEGVKKIQAWEDVNPETNIPLQPSQKYTQTKLAREFQNNLTEFQAQGVTELNELFRDVAHIVNEQGESLDTIANNVENVHTNTRGADLELRSAARYQKNARSKASLNMGIVLDQASLKKAFHPRPDLQSAITAASQAGPEYIELFNQISLYVSEAISQQSPEPAAKKRRIDDTLATRSAPNGASSNSEDAASAPASGNDPVLLEIKDISVVIPQRKKYTLCFTSTHLYARLPTSEDPIQGISYAWKDIEYAFCLPVPEKAQKQYNYILFPKNSIITPAKPSASSTPTPEPIVFTIADAAPKPGTISGSESSAAASVSDDFKTLFNWALSTRLKAAGNGIKITEADPKIFSSAIRQSHRPSEKAVHVSGFRGSKDGYLFFLPTGILWGYKKPLMFLPHERIAAVSYTSVLQRTFNLSIEIDMSTVGGEDATEEVEFQMIDQEDFAGIDEFVKRHGLQDKSMAEQRKAKRLNVNVMKDDEGNVVGNAEAGELERAAAEAEQAAMDEEDEDEEDYDPGSEGESEGSGTSSSEEDEDGEGGGGDDDDEDEDDDDDGEGNEEDEL